MSEASASYMRGELDRRRSMRSGYERIAVLPNAMREPESMHAVRRQSSSETVELLAMHRFTALKNTRLAIMAMTELDERFRLVCLGDGPEREALEELTRTLGLGGRVRFEGFVQDVEPFLASADVLVHPSLAETFCLAAFESARHRIPVACLSIGSLVDSVPRYVVGARADETADSKAFASTVLQALALLEDVDAFEEAANRRRLELDPEGVAREWKELMEEHVRERSSSSRGQRLNSEFCVSGESGWERHGARRRGNMLAMKRKARSAAVRGRRALRRVAAERAKGHEQFECPLCGYRGPFLISHGAVGSRRFAECASCGALERHRLQAEALSSILDQYPIDPAGAAYQFAPDPLTPWLRARMPKLVTADIQDTRADRRLDLRSLDIKDESVSFIFASHVLEHVDEDARAIAELSRVLTPGGMAVLPVPIVASETVEYGEPNPLEDYHVRAPGMDYFDRFCPQFELVAMVTSADVRQEIQPWIHEDRTKFPTKEAPDRPPMEGERHADAVPIFRKPVRTPPPV